MYQCIIQINITENITENNTVSMYYRKYYKKLIFIQIFRMSTKCYSISTSRPPGTEFFLPQLSFNKQS